MSTHYWTGYAGFHAAKKAAREAGRPEPTRFDYVAAQPRLYPLLNRIQQAI